MPDPAQTAEVVAREEKDFNTFRLPVSFRRLLRIMVATGFRSLTGLHFAGDPKNNERPGVGCAIGSSYWWSSHARAKIKQNAKEMDLHRPSSRAAMMSARFASGS